VRRRTRRRVGLPATGGFPVAGELPAVFCFFLGAGMPPTEAPAGLAAAPEAPTLPAFFLFLLVATALDPAAAPEAWPEAAAAAVAAVAPEAEAASVPEAAAASLPDVAAASVPEATAA